MKCVKKKCDHCAYQARLTKIGNEYGVTIELSDTYKYPGDITGGYRYSVLVENTLIPMHAFPPVRVKEYKKGDSIELLDMYEMKDQEIRDFCVQAIHQYKLYGRKEKNKVS